MIKYEEFRHELCDYHVTIRLKNYKTIIWSIMFCKLRFGTIKKQYL